MFGLTMGVVLNKIIMFNKYFMIQILCPKFASERVNVASNLMQ